MLKTELEQINNNQGKELKEAKEKIFSLRQELEKVHNEYKKLSDKYENVLLNLAGLNFKEKFTFERPDGVKEECVQIPRLAEQGAHYNRF